MARYRDVWCAALNDLATRRAQARIGCQGLQGLRFIGFKVYRIYRVLIGFIGFIGFRVQSCGLRLRGLTFRNQGLGPQTSDFGVLGLGFGV